MRFRDSAPSALIAELKHSVNKVHQLQAKAAMLPEHLAAEVLDFLEFVEMRHSTQPSSLHEPALTIRGAFKGRLSSSADFANRKSNEIRLEE